MQLMTFVLAFLPIVPQPFFLQERPASQDSSLAAERRELAEIQLLLGADREYAEAKERLTKLAATLSGRTGTEAKTLLGRVEQLERKVRRALGEPVPDDFSLLVDVIAGQLGDTVDEAVLAAIERQDFAFVRELHKRAVPGLVQAVRTAPDLLPTNAEQDPLWYLADIDPLAASQLVGALLGESGFFWKRRVTNIFLPDVSINRPELWSVGSPSRWLGEGLQQTAEKYAEDPDVGAAALWFLAHLARKGERSLVLDPTLELWLHGDDRDRRETAKAIGKELFDQARFEGLLREDDAELREFAAWGLVGTEKGRLLLQHAGDAQASVRLALVEWLARSNLGEWPEEKREALAKLLCDEDAGVRAKAWKVLGDLPTVQETVAVPAGDALNGQAFTDSRSVFLAPLPDELYRSLLDSPERIRLCSLAYKLRPALGFELLQALAADGSPEVLERVPRALRETDVLAEPDAALRVCSALLDNPTRLPENQKPFDAVAFVRYVARTRRGLEACLRWFVAREDDAVLGALIGEEGLGIIRRNLMSSDPELAAATLARIFGLSRDVARSIVNEMKWTPTPGLSRAFRALARDEARPVGLRILALEVTLAHGGVDEDFLAIARALVAAPGWRDAAELGWSRGRLVHLLGALPGVHANALILRILRDPSLPEGLAVWVVQRMNETEDGAAEIVRLVLGRGSGQESWQEPVGVVLEAMGRVPALQDPEVLAAAARDPEHAKTALWAMGNLRDPRYLPLLAEIVARPDSAWHRAKAVEALFGYLEVEAVEPLLAAASLVTDPELRDKCLAHLEKIREYQDSRERWATRKVKTQTREQVLAQLVEQLSAKSDEVKVQAIRALATWEAVEVMPKLIELTTSGSKSVAAAAREALERLNTPKKD